MLKYILALHTSGPAAEQIDLCISNFVEHAETEVVVSGAMDLMERTHRTRRTGSTGWQTAKLEHQTNRPLDFRWLDTAAQSHYRTTQSNGPPDARRVAELLAVAITAAAVSGAFVSALEAISRSMNKR
ncbi:MAG: hypothetical protein Q9O74_03625 [Planctomycetota bacterium]|nr:hypothetical protein [Planctomycetota bacterium]